MEIESLSELIITFVLGIIASILATSFWEKFSTRIPNTSSSNAPSVNGLWIVKIPYGFRKGRVAYDIIKIRQRRGVIRIYGEHYNNKIRKVLTMVGSGTYISPFISLYYRLKTSDGTQTGTITLMLRQTSGGIIMLGGQYHQYVEKDNDEGRLEIVNEAYQLYKVDLSLKAQIRPFWGKTYFSNVKEIEQFYNEKVMILKEDI